MEKSISENMTCEQKTDWARRRRPGPYVFLITLAFIFYVFPALGIILSMPRGSIIEKTQHA